MPSPLGHIRPRQYSGSTVIERLRSYSLLLLVQFATKKNTGLDGIGDYFLDIASWNVDGFEEQTDQDTFDLWDHLLEQKRLVPGNVF